MPRSTTPHLLFRRSDHAAQQIPPGTTWRLDARTTGRLIDELGGTLATARLLGIRGPSVVRWRSAGMPGYRLAQLRSLVHPAAARSKDTRTRVSRALAAVGVPVYGALTAAPKGLPRRVA